MDETLLQSQISQYTVKEEELLDDKVIQTSKGNLKVFQFDSGYTHSQALSILNASSGT